MFPNEHAPSETLKIFRLFAPGYQIPSVAAAHLLHMTTSPLAQADVYRMIRRRAFAAGIKTRIGNHTFRATRITQYLRNGGQRELAMGGVEGAEDRRRPVQATLRRPALCQPARGQRLPSDPALWSPQVGGPASPARSAR